VEVSGFPELAPSRLLGRRFHGPAVLSASIFASLTEVLVLGTHSDGPSCRSLCATTKSTHILYQGHGFRHFSKLTGTVGSHPAGLVKDCSEHFIEQYSALSPLALWALHLCRSIPAMPGLFLLSLALASLRFRFGGHLAFPIRSAHRHRSGEPVLQCVCSWSAAGFG